MALHTTNIYGNISIADDAVAMVVSKATKECCGVAELVSRRLSDSVMAVFNKEPLSKGVKLITVDNRAFVDVYILVFDGVSVDAVISSVKSSIIYNVEQFTGMRVKSVNVHVVGMRL